MAKNCNKMETNLKNGVNAGSSLYKPHNKWYNHENEPSKKVDQENHILFVQ